MEFTQYDYGRYREQLMQSVHQSHACRHEGLERLAPAHSLQAPRKQGMLLLILSGLYHHMQHDYAVRRLQKLEYKVRFFQQKLYGTM
ncbi:MAG: hypothetical protein GX626_12520 [Spirochaetales bacterium]|mgnify:CR=1 FL=1|jgi:2-iminoacetate synthase ThiH|nr:hypothetical protein [Spirochaetales bacterium]